MNIEVKGSYGMIRIWRVLSIIALVALSLDARVSAVGAVGATSNTSLPQRLSQATVPQPASAAATEIPVSSLTTGHVHIMPIGTGGHPWTEPVAVARNGQPLTPAAGAHLKYYGGPVMQTGKFYTIFWQPAGWHFESPFDGAGANASDTGYETLINRFFQDLNGSTYYNILRQYSQAASVGGGNNPGPTIQTAASLAGTAVSTTAFPSGTQSCGGTWTISDSQLSTEVQSVVAAHGWTVDNNSEFLVYTPINLETRDPSTSMCSGQQFCAYHGTFQTSNSTMMYADMWDTDVNPGCGATTGPNSDNVADQEIAVTSHEMSETVTDPYVGLAPTIANPLAWYDVNNGEIADICNGQDTTAQLGSNSYLVQTLYSNADTNCVSSRTRASLSITAGSATMTSGNPVPTITASYSGFVFGESTASLTAPPTCSTTATNSSPAGAYPTLCSGAVDPSYSITYVPGSLTINAQPTSTATGTAVPPTNTPAAATSTKTNTPVPATSTPIATGGCPAGWTCQDVGSPALAGSQSLSAGTWTIGGGGADIGSTSDQFHFVDQPVGGDSTVTGRVLTQANTNAAAKTGLMLRQSADSAAPFYAIFVTPGNGVEAMWRTAQGAGAGKTSYSAHGLPVTLKLTRTGNSLSAFYSSDGVSYILVPGSAQTINLATSLLAGLVISSHAAGALGAATLSNVSIGTGGPAATATNTSVPPTSTPAAATSTTTNTPVPATSTPIATGGCPAGWTCQDVGSPALAGSQSLSAGTWTIGGGGADIGSTTDQFHFVSQPVGGDTILVARVLSQSNTNAAAKTGLMLRQTTNAASPFYAVFITPGNGMETMWRTVQGAGAAKTGYSAHGLPVYLKLTRSGNSLSAFTSSDGVSYTLVPGSTQTINLTTSLLAGLAVSSHAVGALGTATLSSVVL